MLTQWKKGRRPRKHLVIGANLNVQMPVEGDSGQRVGVGTECKTQKAPGRNSTVYGKMATWSRQHLSERGGGSLSLLDLDTAGGG